MSISKILTLTTLFISSSMLAGTLSHSSNISILGVDGQQNRQGFLTKNNQLNVDKSEHQIVVQVSEIVPKGSDRELFESDLYIITFNADGNDLFLSTPKIKNQFELKRFKKNPNFSLKLKSGGDIAIRFDKLNPEGFFPNSDIEKNIYEYNQKGGVAASKLFMPKQSIDGFQAQGFSSKVDPQNTQMSEQMLKYWFSQADSKTQQSFLKWARKQ